MSLRPASHRLCAALAPLALAACERPARAPAEPPPPAPAPVAAPVALPPATLDRAALLEALDAAASDYAAGRARGGEDLAGRRFAIRQAFGCAGPTQPAPGVAGWRWGERRETIEIALTPSDWRAAPQFLEPGGAWEAVEGFWLPRPWIRDGSCPARLQASAPAAPAAGEGDIRPPGKAQPVPAVQADRQTAGLAAVFAEAGSRVGRRDGRPFSFTLRADDAPPIPPASGYRLVLEGRLTAFPDGRSIHCHAAASELRPVCIAAAEVDRVAFEDGQSNLLREWRPG